MSTVVTPSCDLRKMQEQAKQEYRQMVLDLGADRSVEPAKVREILHASGKDFAALEADVSRVKTRIEAAADLKKVANLAPKVAEAERAEQEARERYDNTRRELQERIDAAYREYKAVAGKAEELRKEKTSLERDARRLLDQTADPSIKEEADTLRRRIGALRDWLNQGTVRDARSLPLKRDKLQEKMSMATSAPVVMGMKNDLAKLNERIEAAQETLDRVAEIEVEMADLEKQILQVESKVYDPERTAWTD